MDTAGTKAEEFVRSVTELGWQDSIDKFNRLYGSPQKQGDDEPNAFELRTITNLQRTPAKTIRTMDLQSKKDPVGRYLFAEDKKNVLLTDRLYSLVPQTAEAIDTLPLVMEFKPDMSCFVIKNININRLDRRQYDTVKAGQAYKETFVNTQSLAAAHFAPENILKRTGFRFADQTRILPDANSAPKTEESM
jgi:hypothetical protein